MSPRLRARRPVRRLPSTRPPLRRIAWTINRLRSGRDLTTNDIASRFEISPRTAHRDLDFLRDQLDAPPLLCPHRPHLILCRRCRRRAERSWACSALAAPAPEVFRTVVDAVVRHRRLRMRYTSFTHGRTRARTVDPCHVYDLRGG